jgi:glycosyltransferase involved in cell wall biosynthesis
MHIYHMLRGAAQPTPWPLIPFGTWRLWDAYVAWPWVEPEKGKWDFANLDKYLSQAEQNRVDVLLPLGLSPTWASARPTEKSGYSPGYAAEFLAISDAFLLPGAVGLAILDAFAAGLPMLTTRFEFHGPEIEYLEEGMNGLMSDHRPAAFAEAASSVLSKPELFNQLRAGAAASAEKYSIENMAGNFRSGIRSCLGLPESLQGS